MIIPEMIESFCQKVGKSCMDGKHILFFVFTKAIKLSSTVLELPI